MSRLQRITVLGATGSIGLSTLDVIARHPDRYETYALTGYSRLDELLALCLKHKPVFAVVPDEASADTLRAGLKTAGTAHPGLQLVAHLPDSLRAEADPDRIAQVFANLISNARHHGDAGHPVEVHAHGTPAGPVVQVRNVAPAIAPEVAADLFTPFKASSVGKARNRSGLGLGLYIAHQIVQGHGGSIGYAHEAPHVVFTVHLPLRPPGATDHSLA